ncbi:DSK2 like with a ubiquitin domain [Cryptosporidium sp. chipmunk genotype I]|uniref:DSK2 like with a ubiquitin domain n=1 Tax=Cryptosporidium sp. chipmunk genotype I TaxID=1280935 RepID=UPI00351AA0F3|nr:DSK2 like with a ubiquitin domain [Cryptosporidium sp. chipmunk genotype I]
MASVDEISIVFKVSGGTQFNISVPRNTTIKDLKDRISEPSSIPSSQQRLIYKGRILKDNDSLDEMKVESGHTMHLVKSGVQTENQKPQNISDQTADHNSSNNSQATNNNTSQNLNSIPPTCNGTNNGANQNPNDPFAAMMNMLSGSDLGFQAQNLRDFSQNSYNGFGGGPNNNFGNIPDLNSLMNSPIFQQSINELANNPQLVRNILHSNPMFAQLSANNPMLDQMLNNPEMMRMMLNPQMIQSVLNSNNMNSSNANSNQFSSPNGGFSSTQLNGLLNDPSIASMLSGITNGANRNINSNAPNPMPQMYATQLSQLRDMGFIDVDASLSALQESGGDINAAINKLLERGIGQ